MMNRSEALETMDRDERLQLGEWYVLADDAPPRPSEEGDVQGIDYHLGNGAVVTLLPQSIYILRADRSRQARLRLNEFLEGRARIIAQGDRWLFFVDDNAPWPDFHNGLAFRIEGGRIVYPKEWNGGWTLAEQAVADYSKWYLTHNEM